MAMVPMALGSSASVEVSLRREDSSAEHGEKVRDCVVCGE
jgi:hypothetical protein